MRKTLSASRRRLAASRTRRDIAVCVRGGVSIDCGPSNCIPPHRRVHPGRSLGTRDEMTDGRIFRRPSSGQAPGRGGIAAARSRSPAGHETPSSLSPAGAAASTRTHRSWPGDPDDAAGDRRNGGPIGVTPSTFRCLLGASFKWAPCRALEMCPERVPKCHDVSRTERTLRPLRKRHRASQKQLDADL
jgi:hypothetical protein